MGDADGGKENEEGGVAASVAQQLGKGGGAIARPVRATRKTARAAEEAGEPQEESAEAVAPAAGKRATRGRPPKVAAAEGKSAAAGGDMECAAAHEPVAGEAVAGSAGAVRASSTSAMEDGRVNGDSLTPRDAE